MQSVVQSYTHLCVRRLVHAHKVLIAQEQGRYCLLTPASVILKEHPLGAPAKAEPTKGNKKK